MTNDSIYFPGLNIILKNVGRGIDIFGFSIAFYGMIIAIGMLLAAIFIHNNAKRYNENPDILDNMTIYGIICGVIGARLYYCIFSWDLYKDNILSVLNLRNGGLAIYGGIIGGALLVIFYTKRRGIRFLTGADIVMPAVLIGQILGRWGNFFNREAFGDYSSGILRMGIPVSAVRSTADITDAMREHMEVVDGIRFIYVHPTFLYESLWNLMTFIIMLIVAKRGHKPGTILGIYLLFYGVGRFLIERLRTDQLLIPHTAIPVSMAVSAACVLLAVAIFTFQRKNSS